MRLDAWYYGMSKWGFYAGLRLGRLLAGVGSDGWGEFEVGIELSTRIRGNALCLHLGWLYLLLVWDKAYDRDGDTQPDGVTDVAENT